jgi:hypothetical protein
MLSGIFLKFTLTRLVVPSIVNPHRDPREIDPCGQIPVEADRAALLQEIPVARGCFAKLGGVVCKLRMIGNIVFKDGNRLVFP